MQLRKLLLARPSRLWLPFAALAVMVMALASIGAVRAAAQSEWTETLVAGNSADQIYPRISGNKIVWQDYRNQSAGCPSVENCLPADIYEKDLSTGVERRLTSAPTGLDPDISGDLVVWRDWSTGKIVVYDLDTGTLQNASVTTGSFQQDSPAISGNRVVWTDYRASTQYGQIYMRDLSTSTDTLVAAATDPNLAPAQRDKQNPAIDGDIVAWEDWRNAYQDSNGWWHNPDIYAKNIVTGQEYAVCTDPSDQYSPAVSGHRVFWQDYRNGKWDVYMKDLDTGVETRLSPGTGDQSWPRASGDFVVWKDTRNGREDIYLHRISTGTDQIINQDSQADYPTASAKMPVIDGTTIAWMDNRSGNWDVYSARDTVPPQISGLVPIGWQQTSAFTISAAFSDGGTGVNPATVSVAMDGNPVAGCAASAAGVSCPVSGVAEGSHTISVQVSDNAGNQAVASVQTGVDTQAPVISNPQPTGSLTTGNVSIAADYGDGASGSGVDTGGVSVTLDGAPVPGCSVTATQVSCPETNLADGNHDVTLDVPDQAGLTGHAAWSFTVDAAPPSVSNLQPAGGAAIDNAWPAISVDFAAGGRDIDPASIHMYLDGQDVTAATVIGSGSATYSTAGGSRLADGQHQARFVIADTRGKTTDVSWSFSVESPAFSLSYTRIYWVDPADYNNRYLSVDFDLTNVGTGAANNASISAVSVTNGVIGASTLPMSLGNIGAGGDAKYTFNFLIPVGVSNFRVITYANCKDDGGNLFMFPGPPPGWKAPGPNG